MPDTPIPFRWIEPWSPDVNLETPAGKVLTQLVRLLPVGSRLTLYGSAPLEICLDPKFLSEDIDCFGFDELQNIVEQSGLGARTHRPYVQVGHDLNFQTSPRWMTRAYTFPIEGRIVVFPHPIDILIGKLHRLEEKDLKAFQLVREKTGHPTENELIQELRGAVDLYRPGFDEEKNGDLKITTRLLWSVFFQKEIDVVREIIQPALRLRKEGYAPDNPKTDYKALLSPCPPQKIELS